MTAPPSRTRDRIFVWLAWIVLTAATVWLLGLIWFAETIPRDVGYDDQPTDAIVVLTGGSGRLNTGLDLLRKHKAAKLFVSGVYQGVDVQELLKLARSSPDAVECCIVLGHAADNTAGNAVETARWMADQGFRSLRLVTANYHMRRSLLEFRRAMPGVTIVPHPVMPALVHLSAWWRWPGTTNLIVNEYDKYLAAAVRAAFAVPIEAEARIEPQHPEHERTEH
ncbi:MAG: YdcF family protein [Azospirillaceae bacterium]|nr:YdcF family protein [Azospirillaceae bacterium]